MQTASAFRPSNRLQWRGPFVGQVLRRRPALLDAARPRLVGLRVASAADSPAAPLRAGALLRAADGDTIEGHVSSVTRSPECTATIALGFLARGLERRGETVTAHDPLAGRDVAVQVTDPVFVDPGGERLHA